MGHAAAGQSLGKRLRGIQYLLHKADFSLSPGGNRCASRRQLVGGTTRAGCVPFVCLDFSWCCWNFGSTSPPARPRRRGLFPSPACCPAARPASVRMPVHTFWGIPSLSKALKKACLAVLAGTHNGLYPHTLFFLVLCFA